MKRILVTGANGHIGSHTVRSLLQRGYEVVPMVRATSDLRGIANLGLTYQIGDVLDYPSLRAAVDGCDAIIHHAAVYRLWAKSPREVMTPAIEGTRNIFRAAKESGVGRLVYTSSTAAVGSLSKPEGLLTPTHWNDHTKTAYFIAKTQSEREAVRLSEEYQIPTVRLCPAMVLGPYDYGITPSTQEFINLVNQKKATYESGENFVHVADVGEIHALAIEHGEPGSRYIIGGKNLHLKDFSALITKYTGLKLAHTGVTGPMAEFVGAVMGLPSKFTGSAPLYDEKMVSEMVGRYAYYDCSDTERTFGIMPRSIDEILTDTMRWLLFLGKIKPEIAERISPLYPPRPEWVNEKTLESQH